MQVDIIQVSTDHLDGVNEEIAHRYEAITEILGDMETDLRPLESDWTGAASEAYAARMVEWREGLADMAGTLNRIATMVGSGSSDYGQTEENVLAGWA